MKKCILLTLYSLVMLFSLSCKKIDEVNPKDEEIPVEFSGRWILQRMEFLNGQPPKNKPVSEDIVIKFEDEKLEKFEGATANNGVKGEFKHLGENRIQVVEFAYTLAEDTEWGNRFFSVMPNVNQYSVTKSKELILQSNNEKLIFKKD